MAAPVTQNVDLDVGSLNIDQTMGKIVAHVRKIEDAIRKAQLDSTKIGKNFDQGLGQVAKQFNQSLSRLDQFEKTLLRFGRQGLKPGTLTKELQAANSAMDKLLVKKQRLERNVGAGGGNATEYQQRQAALLDRQIADLTKLQGAFAKAQVQAQKFGIDGAEEIGKINALLDSMSTKLSSSRAFNVTNMLGSANAELTQLQEKLARTGAAEELHTAKLRGQVSAIRTVGEVELQRAAAMTRIDALQKQLSTATEAQTRSILRETAALKLEIDLLRQRDKELTRGTATTKSATSGGVLASGVIGKAPSLFGGAGGYSSYLPDPRIYLALQGLNTIREGAQFLVEFDDQLHQLQAISAATSGQMETLKKDILDVGTSSKFSLVDLTKMATKLAQAGVTAGQMGAALKSVSTLATASGSSPDEAVDLVTASLGAFQLQAGEATRVADLFTAALNQTRLTVNQGALAIQYVGNTAAQQNITLEETLATAAALSQAGIRSGSTIGTGFRTFLTDLQSPTEKLQKIFKQLKLTQDDLNVSTRGLIPVLETLKKAGFDSALAYDGLEKRSASFYVTAANNTDLMQELELSMIRQGQAVRANAAAMDSLSSQWQRFLNVAGKKLDDNFSPWVNAAKAALKGLNDALEEQKKGGSSTGWSFTNVLANFAGPGVAEGFGAADAAVRAWNDHAEEAKGRATDLTEAIAETNDAFSAAQDTYNSAEEAIARLVQRQAELPPGSRAVQIETERLVQRFPALVQYLDLSTSSVNNLTNALGQLAVAQANALAGVAAKQISTGYDQARRGGRGLGGLYAAIESGQVTDPGILKVYQQIRGKPGRANNLYGQLAAAVQASGDPNATKYLGNLSDIIGGLSSVSVGTSNMLRFDVTSDPSYQAALEKSRRLMVNPKTTAAERAAFQKEVAAGAARQKTAIGKSTWMGLSRDVVAAHTASQVTTSARKPAGTGGGTSDERSAQRNREIIARMGERTAEKQMTLAISDLNRSVDQASYDTAVETAKKARDNVIAKLTEQANTEAAGMKGSAEKDARMQQLEDDKQRVMEQFDNSLFDSIKHRFEAIMDAASTAYEKAVADDARTHGISRLEGSVAGLDLFSNRDTPDFVRQLAENRLAKQQEALLPGQLSATLTKISASEGALAGLRADQAKVADDPVKSQNLIDQITAAQAALDKLYDDADKLRATIDAVNLAPHTLGEGLKQAADAYFTANNLGRTWNQEILANMTGALTQAHQSLTTFFSDILTGSRTVLGAFGNLAKGIINYLQQLAAQFIANKIFGSILGLIGSSLGSTVVKPDLSGIGSIADFSGVDSAISAYGGHRRLGGPVSPGKFYEVNEESTAPGLFIPLRAGRIEPPSSRSTLNDLQAQGSRLRSRMPGMAAAAIRPVNQMTNVYVVAPEEQPTLGPDDVRVIIAQDILDGGVTKKLVKQVAQGA